MSNTEPYPAPIELIYTVQWPYKSNEGEQLIRMTEKSPPLYSLSHRFSVEWLTGPNTGQRFEILHQPKDRVLTVALPEGAHIRPGDTWKYY